MLRRIGFRYAERIDPFDGGPHFVALADEITLIRKHAAPLTGFTKTARVQGLIGRDLTEPPYFRAASSSLVLGATARSRSRAMLPIARSRFGSELFFAAALTSASIPWKRGENAKAPRTQVFWIGECAVVYL